MSFINKTPYKNSLVYGKDPRRVNGIKENSFINEKGIYNVRAYGAKGDGVSDDTDAIRLALGQAERFLNKNGGDSARVWFPEGIYNYCLRTGDSQYSTPSPAAFVLSENNIELCGAGKNLTTLNFRSINNSNPEKNWATDDNGNGYSKIRRGGGIKTNGTNLSGVILSGILFDGGCPALGDATVGGVNVALGSANNRFYPLGTSLTYDCSGDFIYRSNQSQYLTDNGDLMWFFSGPPELTLGTGKQYYVVETGASGFKLSETSGGAPVSLTNTSGFTGAIIFNAPTEENRPLSFGNTAPSPISTNSTMYYVVQYSGKSFAIADAVSGSPISVDNNLAKFYATTESGWDMTHKAIFTANGVNVHDCAFKNWRGEMIHNGGDEAKTNFIYNTDFSGCDASCISMPSTLMSGCTVIDTYNGIENFVRQNHQVMKVYDSTFTITQNYNNGSNAIAALSLNSAGETEIYGCQFSGYSKSILLSEMAANVDISGNDFKQGRALHISHIHISDYSGDWPNASFNNITVQNNEFRNGANIYTQFGPQGTFSGENNNFKIIGNNFYTGDKIIQEFTWMPASSRTGYIISGNYINCDSDRVVDMATDSPRAIWSNNTTGSNFEKHTRQYWYSQDWDGSTPISMTEISGPITQFNNYANTGGVKLTIESGNYGVWPEGFATQMVNTTSYSFLLVADSGWNTFTGDVVLAQGSPVSLVVDSSGLFGLA